MDDKLELGCGERPTLGYLHQDVIQIKGTNLDFICSPWEIPLEKETLSEVLALGVMEHLRYSEFEKTIQYVYNLLKKDGEFLFDVPDMKVWSEYLYNLTHEMQEKNPFPPKHIWATIYGWQRWPGDEHKSGWTNEELIKLLNQIGFKKIETGVQVFTSKGIERGRFSRKGDAHIYIKAIK
jgi:predicted SAM-dependent methyltransferase